jgi:hypothetical protein
MNKCSPHLPGHRLSGITQYFKQVKEISVDFVIWHFYPVVAAQRSYEKPQVKAIATGTPKVPIKLQCPKFLILG